MRAIDADALIEILTTAIRTVEGMAKFLGAEDDPEIKMEIKAYTDILEGVKEQPTIEPKPKWIPVSERIPESHDKYLITTNRGTVHVARYTIFGWNTNLRQCVIAWMPLPEPYEEGAQDGQT